MSVADVPVAALPEPHRFTRDDFYRLADLGFIAPDERLELVEGELLIIMPENPPHFTANKLANEALVRAFAGVNAHAHAGHPVVLGPRSETVPDVALVQGTVRQYATRRVTGADVLLLVEVSDATLEYDRTTKRDLYANAGIWEYWIVNVRARQVEVFRAPVNGVYTDTFAVAEAGSIAALAAPGAVVPVAELLP